MLRSVQIEGFRGFKSFALHDLGRVNLLVGANNSGKTSLLEAIDFLVSGDLGALADAMSLRGEKVLTQGVEPLLDVRRLFHGFTLGDKKRLTLVGEDGGAGVRELVLELREASRPAGPFPPQTVWELVRLSSAPGVSSKELHVP